MPTTATIDDIRGRAADVGRDPEDIVFFQGTSFIVGGTEEEAQRKAAELDQGASLRGYAAHIDGVTPVLQERGLQQREYTPGTLREKLASGAAEARLPDSHPGGRTRRERLGAGTPA